ncbi:MAG: PDZ domain-containing protein [Anaerolineae bacterium]|nr:PDZ domain-containing protein [Anaerolineae bacterium]
MAADRKAAMEMVQVSGQQGVPVITVDGQVVVGFNQPRLRQLLQSAKPGPGPKLGAAVADAGSQARKRPGIPTSGAYVGKVRPGTPAARAGLRSGDVITALGGQPIILAEDLHRLVSQMPSGRDVSLTYVRGGHEHDTLIRL